MPALRAFVFSRHVDDSSYSAASRAAQESDLFTDFPDLVSPEAFAQLSLGGWLVKNECGAIVGACGLKRSDQPSEVFLSYLFVAPSHRGKGLGRNLLRAALDAADSHAASLPAGSSLLPAVRLLTLEGVYEAAVRLYESEGFVLERRVPASAEPGACPHYTLLYMQRPLRGKVEHCGGGSVGGGNSSSSSSSSNVSAGCASEKCPSLEPTVHLSRGDGLKLLVLHGFSQNGPDFLARYKPLLDRKLKFCALVAPSAPFSLAQDKVQRTWWYKAADPFQPGEYEGLATSRALIQELLAQQGPFDGVLGFSQGAVFAHQLIAEGTLIVRFAILASGFPSRCVDAGAPLITIPSLHLTSKGDATVPSDLHLELASKFASSLLLEHEHGHALVQKAEHCKQVIDFVVNAAAKK